jgi:hypothetical protein
VSAWLGRDVPLEKGELLAQDLLEQLAGVDVEVPGWVGADLAAGCACSVAQCGCGRCDAVVLADAEQDRAADFPGAATGTGEWDGQDCTRRNVVATRSDSRVRLVRDGRKGSRLLPQGSAVVAGHLREIIRGRERKRAAVNAPREGLQGGTVLVVRDDRQHE